VVADRRRRLSDGALVEATILARVLGMRLLKLDASVVIVPADLAAPASDFRRSPARSHAVGHGLAGAVRSINEGAALLANARRNGS
jgi:hypothetical protein